MSQHFSREPLARMLNLRVSADQDRLLSDLVERLGLASKSEVVRRALDFWLEHAPEARRSSRKGSDSNGQ